MSNEEIVEQIQKGIEVTSNQERLWQKNKGFVVRCIKKYVGSCDEQDFDDFLQEGFIGLAEAARSFDSGNGVKFLTYAEYRIRRSVYRYNGLSTYMVRVPEYLKTRMRRLAAFKLEHRSAFGREPEPEEIQEALHISGRSLCHLEKTLLSMRTRSLDEYISEDGRSSLLDLLSDDERIDELAGGGEYQRELHDELDAALRILDQKTALMIRCAYYQGNSYTKTAGIFGCSRQAVDERIKKGFYKILCSKHRERLESFMWEGYHADPRRLSGYADMEELDNMGSGLLL